jgi:eps5I
MKFLSIIIPVYKVEEFIEECLSSCLNQHIPANVFEVIAVDDGSPDRCGDILDKYANRYANMKVIHQNNQGLSAARNSGLDIAEGEYVWFVDSDDWIEPDALSVIADALIAKPDILQVGFNYVWPDRIVPNRQYVWDGIITGCIAYLKEGIPAPAQFTIVKRTVLVENNLRFYAGILHEDTEYKPKLAIVSEKAACLDKPIYNYRQRESGNIMSSYSMRNAKDLITGCRSIINFLSNRHYNKQEHKVIGNAIGENLNHLLNRLAHYTGPDYEKIVGLLRENKDLFHWIKKSDRIKYRMESILFRLNFNLAFRLIQFSQLHR